MRVRLFLLAVGAWLALFQASASAILLETEKKQKVAGYLISKDAQKIVVRIKTPEGKDKTTVHDATKVKVLHEVDLAKLGTLAKEKPKAYYDYAKELGSQKADPEAVDTALRLYVIAAFLDPVVLGERSLLSMSELATQPGDVRKYLAMAYLLNAKGDATMLKTAPAKKGGAEVKAAPKGLPRFQKALERYRTGDVVKAKTDANAEGVSDFFTKAGLDQRSFLQACDDLTCTKCKRTGTVTCATCSGKGKVIDMNDPFGGGFRACSACTKGKQKCSTCNGDGLNPFPDNYLRAILRAEVWALDQIVTVELTSKKSTGGWGDALGDRPTRSPLLTLETITEYDPRQCLYRNGKWTAP